MSEGYLIIQNPWGGYISPEGALDQALHELYHRIWVRADIEHSRAHREHERINRSLGQKFRHVREEEIAGLRQRIASKRFSLTNSFLLKQWSRKLMESMRQSTFIDRFTGGQHEGRESRSGPQG